MADAACTLNTCHPATQPLHLLTLPSSPSPQVYELKKDEIDGALDKARAQITSLNDKYFSKVGFVTLLFALAVE